MDNNRLYVGGIPYSATDEDLKHLFSQAGQVVSASILRDKAMNNRSRGYGFVEMGSPEDTNKAIEMFHDSEMDGRKLTVNLARPREERTDSNGGGSYSNRGGDNNGGSYRRDR